MMLPGILLIFITASVSQLCSGQINPLDSCGMDSNPILNSHEISILDSLFFVAKKPLNGRFDFKNKNVAFYSCTKNSNTNGNGFLTKQDFFSLCKPDFKGHAGRGLIAFNEKEKSESNGFDVVVLIDCPYDRINKAVLIKKLQKWNTNKTSANNKAFILPNGHEIKVMLKEIFLAGWLWSCWFYF
jgi:hypothetical protein